MKIFVISLIDATHRRCVISETMKKLNIDFEFFDAVDGRQGLPTQYESMVNRPFAQRRLGRAISDGEIACALSHALLYKKIADDNIKHAIILEDDAIITEDFATMVQQKTCENLGKDFIFLYHLYARAIKKSERRFLQTDTTTYQAVSLAKTPNGAVAYYLNHKMASYLANTVLPLSWVSDWGVDIVRTHQVSAITPRIVTHPPMVQSTLEHTRTGNKTYFQPFGFKAWMRYKIKKCNSYKISSTIEGK